MAYQADGDYDNAAKLFSDLIDEHPHRPEAYESLVPLARCQIASNQAAQAEQLLRGVVTDHPAITPDSQAYREALIELARLYYDREQYEDAVQRLALAVERYGESAEGALLRFRLADAYRRSIAQIDRTLTEPMARSRELALRAHRAERLEKAQILYSQVISDLESRDVAALSPLAKLFYRNAYFYRADCAYDLARYEQAISLYDLAARRWESDPASLVALVQIVNAYCELDMIQEARVANDRARFQLDRIPDKAFEDEHLPMKRQHWEDWLRWSEQLDLFGSTQTGTASASTGS